MRDYEPSKMKNIPFTGIRRVMEKANKLQSEGKSIIHFEAGQPDFDTPANIKEAAKKALDEGKTAYSSNYGFPELRKAIAEKMKKMNGIDADPMTEIMVTSGGEESVACAILSLLEKGDEVLVPDPGYIPYGSLVKLAEAIPVPVPLKAKDNFCYNVAEMEKLITPKTKMVILCSPGNPTGTAMSLEALKELAEFCKKHDLLVISDEAYEQVLYDGTVHTSIASLPDMKCRTITVQSFSKTYSMCGWRIGYTVTSAELLKVMVRAHQTIVMNACAFGQYGAIEALRGPQDSLAEMLKEFDRRRILLYEGLKDLGIPCNKPQAAFYVFPDISEFGMGSFEFAEYLLDNYGVATVPGVEFGQSGEGHLRISYATSYENVKEGLRRIGECVKELRSKKN